MMRFGPRSSLIADRELQPNYRSRANREAFGIFRPLTPKSAMHVSDVLTGAKVDIDHYLKTQRKIAAEIKLSPDFGVTFVGRNHVKQVMRRGMLQRTFHMGRLMHQIESHRAIEEVRLEVPFDGFDWFSDYKRKLVGKFAASKGLDELHAQADLVGEFMHDAGGDRVRVHNPDHVSFYKYGSNGDNRDLNGRDRREIIGIVAEHFSAADIDSVTLGPINIGDTYNLPLGGLALRAA